MISSDVNTYQSQTNDNQHVLSNLISSTSINPIQTNAESILMRALPAPLAAPAGWRSEIIHSNSPIPTDTAINLSSTNTSYQNDLDGPYKIINTTRTDQLSSGYIGNSNEYLSTSVGGNVSQQGNSWSSGNAYVDGYASTGGNILQQGNSWKGGNTYVDERASIGGNITQRGNTYIDEHASIGGNISQHGNTWTGGNILNRTNTVLTQQQQQNIINTVEHQNPLIIRKTLPNNTVTYQQNVSVRYLQPPTPPPPGPIIIREVRPPPPPPQSPIQIRQRAPPAPTPPPIILRERPPPLPPRDAEKVVEKLLPPPPRPERRVIVERYGACPPKPSDVIIERWLPYKQTGERRVVVQRAPTPCIRPAEPNLLVLHDSPRACIHKEYINQGVVRADPDDYVRQYGADLGTWHRDSRHAHLVDEASRAIPPPFISSGHHHQRHDYRDYYSDGYERSSSPCVQSSTWERSRVLSPIPRCASYHHDTSCYDTSDYGYDYRRSHDNCYRERDSYLTCKDVTPSWNRHCRSSSYDRYPSKYSSYSSYCPSDTIRVGSDNEFHRVMSDLTCGHAPSKLHCY
ncbi:unnamed protein product [Adineta steineri]|uniref:Uncharacterized protein n=1 Tax=Adineta steineri TaxID=433720 RepID=A0A815MKM0_9BILA|nr:unnamed protein product [Adineta steineri]CAF1417631.1 unnamed protein product [Adineta steineri]CAF1491789.1 unnamed protein product [Adineta steineri]